MSEPTLDSIDWTCDTCHDKANGQGAISISYDDINRADAVRKSPDFARLSVADALAQSQLGLWKVQCDVCAGECIGAYWIDLRKLRDDADVAEWTRHLNAKTWFGATNWDAVVDSSACIHPVRTVWPAKAGT